MKRYSAANAYCGLLCMLLLALTVFFQPAWAQETDTLSVANRLYERGNYDEASRLYQELVAQGYSDPALFHNLGNAAMQQGEVGRAIVNYERVLRLAPTHEASRANLAQAESQVESQFNAVENSTISDLFMRATTYFTRTQIAVAALGVWLLWGVGYLVHRRLIAASSSRIALALLTLAVLVTTATFLTVTWVDRNEPAAVVIAPEAAVYAQASVSDRALFTLFDGTGITITSPEKGGWVQVALADADVRGWVSAEAIERIVLP